MARTTHPDPFSKLRTGSSLLPSGEKGLSEYGFKLAREVCNATQQGRRERRKGTNVVRVQHHVPVSPCNGDHGPRGLRVRLIRLGARTVHARHPGRPVQGRRRPRPDADGPSAGHRGLHHPAVPRPRHLGQSWVRTSARGRRPSGSSAPADLRPWARAAWGRAGEHTTATTRRRWNTWSMRTPTSS